MNRDRAGIGKIIESRFGYLSTGPKLDFPHFGRAPGYRAAQKMSSEAMYRSASSSDSTVRPNGPALAHFSRQSDQ